MTRQRNSDALPPSARDKPWMSVMVRLEQYVKLKEIAEFRELAMGRILQEFIDAECDRVIKEARAEAQEPERKESDVSDHRPVTSRYRF